MAEQKEWFKGKKQREQGREEEQAGGKSLGGKGIPEQKRTARSLSYEVKESLTDLK